MSRAFSLLLALIVIGAQPNLAAADAPAATPDASLLTTSTPLFAPQMVRRPLVLGHGMIELSINTEADLTADAAFAPVSIAPDLRYGLTDRMTIGLIHSNQSLGFIGSVGNGICLAGVENGCPNRYNRTGLEWMYSLAQGPTGWTLAVRGYAMLRGHIPKDEIPFGAIVGGGVRARWTRGRTALQLEPLIAVSTFGDDTELFAQLFARGYYQLSQRFVAHAGTGYYGPVDHFGALPVAAGIGFAVDGHIDLGATAALIDVSDGIDARSLTVNVTYRM